MKRLDVGTELDGFVVDDCIHAGGMAHIYQVHYANGNPDPFPMCMKVPRMTLGEGAENLVGFEVEHRILQMITGSHMPRFVAAGDLERMPYLVLEYIAGQTLEKQLSETTDHPADFDQIAALGAQIAHALQHLHRQNVCHLDLKPANILMGKDGRVVLLDFGLSSHAHLPDLLAEQMRKAVGSPAWISPEQIVGVRGDPRSDIFALGVILYEWVTGELPFGAPTTQGGMRQRMWMRVTPPCAIRPDTPAWLQEIILRCLEPEAKKRYQSAAHLAFDLTHPTQVKITALGLRTKGIGFWKQFKRWIRAAGKTYEPSPLPTRQIEEVPIIMVCLPHYDVSETTLYALREATKRSLGVRPGARLACVTVVSPNDSSYTDSDQSDSAVHRHHMIRLRDWAAPLDLDGQQTSFHVLESSDVSETLLEYARTNHVTLIIMGAATHGLRMQHFIATVPIKVAMEAPCTMILVKQDNPYGHVFDEENSNHDEGVGVG